MNMNSCSCCYENLLQETYCLFLLPATGDCCLFSGPSSLTFSTKTAILELKGGENKNSTLCMMFRKVKSFIYEKIYCSDRVTL